MKSLAVCVLVLLAAAAVVSPASAQNITAQDFLNLGGKQSRTYSAKSASGLTNPDSTVWDLSAIEFEENGTVTYRTGQASGPCDNGAWDTLEQVDLTVITNTENEKTTVHDYWRVNELGVRTLATCIDVNNAQYTGTFSTPMAPFRQEVPALPLAAGTSIAYSYKTYYSPDDTVETERISDTVTVKAGRIKIPVVGTEATKEIEGFMIVTASTDSVRNPSGQGAEWDVQRSTVYVWVTNYSDEGYVFVARLVRSSQGTSLGLYGPLGAPAAVHAMPGASAGVRLAPNPADAEARFQLSLPRAGDVSISIVSTDGRLIARVGGQRRDAGRHEFIVPTSGVPSGVYHYRVDVDGTGVASGSLLVVH